VAPEKLEISEKYLLSSPDINKNEAETPENVINKYKSKSQI
jgi:hypothetical protein